VFDLKQKIASGAILGFISYILAIRLMVAQGSSTNFALICRPDDRILQPNSTTPA
jgi:hypothetical protein